MAPTLCGTEATRSNQPLNLAVHTRMLARDVQGALYEPTKTAKNFVKEFRRQLCTVKECTHVKHDLIADKKLDCPASD